MNNLFVFCGAPGSGKTTTSKKFAEQYKAARYSFDEMGCLRHYELIPYIQISLKDGIDVVVDSTYAEKKIRIDLLKAIDNIDCKKTLIFMDTNLDECIRRNANRPQSLSRLMVENIFYMIQRPTLEEGWDEILYLT